MTAAHVEDARRLRAILAPPSAAALTPVKLLSRGAGTLKRAASKRNQEPEIVVAVSIRSLFIAALGLASLPGAAFAQSACPGIHVKILDIRNSTGGVACAIFESEAGFPTEFLLSATKVMIMKVRDTQARCDFEDLPPGDYALAVIHDENMNGKLDTNWFGIPSEGYGFSNDAKALLGAPSFSAAGFQYDGRTLDLTISLHY
jgi:uncharacterized protein (DUF2141 family)